MNGVYDKMSGPTRMARSNKDRGKATDSLGSMVAAVPVLGDADLGTETQNKQGVSAGSIGRESKKSRPERMSNQQVQTRIEVVIESGLDCFD